MARLAPYVFTQEFDNNGSPLAAGKIYTYEAGTTTPKSTYTDSTGLSANTNPIILDSAGRANIWLGSGAYKFIIKTSADVTIETVDNISGDAENAFGSQVINQSTNLSITAAYKNALIYCTAAITLSLDAVATLGEGFYFTAVASNGNVTIDPSGAELINGASTFTLLNGQSALIICEGTKWYVAFYPVAATTQAAGDSTTKIATTAFVNSTALTLTTGTTAVTQSAGDSTTKVATTAFINSAGVPIRKVAKQSFTSSGTYTPSTGMVYCIVEGTGGGGGGGGATTSATGSAAGGGGGGGYFRHLATAADIGASQTVTIGAAGTAGSAGNNNGGAGGNTSLGAICSGNGGSGGTGAAASGGFGAGGAGGSSSGNIVAVTGQTGATGIAVNNLNMSVVGGEGGASFLGHGGPSQFTNGGTAGATGQGYGGGGSGGGSFGGAASVAGGAGTAGIIIITEFCTQ